MSSNPNSPVPIRNARESDSGEIARLCTQLGYPAHEEEMGARLASLKGSDAHWIAVAAGPDSNLLGWVAAEHRLSLESGERVEIVGLVVDRAARRRGVGRALVSAVEAWAVSRGVSTILVRSNVARSDSHEFYTRSGYGRIKTQHAYAKNL